MPDHSKPKPGTIISGGGFYGRRSDTSPLEKMDDQEVDRPPDAWICRRLADYAPAAVPALAARGECAICHAPIAFNPARLATVPPSTRKVCMQCAGIQPLPMES